MNKVQLTGRLTSDPRTNNNVVRFNLAVNRRFKKEGQPDADFIPCVAFGKTADFIAQYFTKGMKAEVCGRIQTGNYQKDGQTIYTTDVVVEECEFGESKKAAGEQKFDYQQASTVPPSDVPNEGFMNISDDEELPFQ